MAAPPLPPSLHVSDFFERKRRLAYHFAWLAMTLLLVQLAVGFVPAGGFFKRLLAVSAAVQMLDKRRFFRRTKGTGQIASALITYTICHSSLLESSWIRSRMRFSMRHLAA